RGQRYRAGMNLEVAAEVGDLVVQGRDRDPLVADDRRGAHLDRTAPGYHEPGAQHEGGHLDEPPEHRHVLSHVAAVTPSRAAGRPAPNGRPHRTRSAAQYPATAAR